LSPPTALVMSCRGSIISNRASLKPGLYDMRNKSDAISFMEMFTNTRSPKLHWTSLVALGFHQNSTCVPTATLALLKVFASVEDLNGLFRHVKEAREELIRTRPKLDELQDVRYVTSSINVIPSNLCSSLRCFIIF
jgi:hypothetical protein